MNIKSVTLINYRNFENFSIDFSNGFQTIIGENNIGKSNLYWAIRLILDSSVPPNARYLTLNDFHGFKTSLQKSDYVIISIDLYGEDLASSPTFLALKNGENTARVTYLYAHKSIFDEVDEEETVDAIEIADYKWRLFGSGTSLELHDILELNYLKMSDLEGINVHYINAFRNTSADIYGSTKSLLTKYFQTRSTSESELMQIKSILNESSDRLNALSFMPDIESDIKAEGTRISGEHFSFPIGLGFHSVFDIDALNQMNIYFKPADGLNVPIQLLGLGQKNILYLSLFIASLTNSTNSNDFNLLLIEEPEAHLHPQLQKALFSNLHDVRNIQILLSSHSTHIASDCSYKNLNILYKKLNGKVGSFSPFKDGLLSERENKLLKRYLDATRSELFFSSGVIFVEGVAEQFILPAIASSVYGINLVQYNISVVPIHSRFFRPYLKIVQEGNLEIPAVAIIDGDRGETTESDPETTAVRDAMSYQVPGRVMISAGEVTLESDLFPNPSINTSYLERCFSNLGHSTSYANLIRESTDNPESWSDSLIKRIDGTITKGRFSQELSMLIDSAFVVPNYIHMAIMHMKSIIEGH